MSNFLTGTVTRTSLFVMSEEREGRNGVPSSFFDMTRAAGLLRFLSLGFF